MRTSTRAAPVPKLARTSGAYTLARRPPKMPRTEAVASTTLEPSGSPDPGPTTSRFPGGPPCCASAAHMAGSQARMAPTLTWPATQAAAWSRAAVAAVTGTDDAGRAGDAAAPEAGRGAELPAGGRLRLTGQFGGATLVVAGFQLGARAVRGHGGAGPPVAGGPPGGGGQL